MSEPVSEEFLSQMQGFANELMDGIVAHGVAERGIRGAMVRVLVDELRTRRAADLSADELALIDTALGHLASNMPPYDCAPKYGEVEALRAKLTKGAR